jgi:hypothetical protein
MYRIDLIHALLLSESDILDTVSTSAIHERGYISISNEHTKIDVIEKVQRKCIIWSVFYWDIFLKLRQMNAVVTITI